ncbi:MAG: FAD-binding oxidoreductase [Bacteroidota bacterium]
MKTYTVPILSIRKLTHDVLEIRTEKPDGYAFLPGQATELAINRKDWKGKKRPFTFTSIPTDGYLEFIIKMYPSHQGVTRELATLAVGDTLIIEEPWGAISYQGSGLFIAGGAGITPFISIFRQLTLDNKLVGNKLIFANKTHLDIILENELNALLEKNIVHVLSNDFREGYVQGFVTKTLIRENMVHASDNIYLCGPPIMMDAVMLILQQLDIDQTSITVEI